MRLRSSRIIEIKKQPSKEDTEEQQEQIYAAEADGPKTPPGQSIESYFPPSPFGKKRHQTNGDRFTISRKHSLDKDFTCRHSTKNEREHKESKRITAYFRAEVLDDPYAAEEYISTTQSVQPMTPNNPHSTYNTTIGISGTDSLLSSEFDSTHVNIFESPNALKFQTSPISEMGRRILLSKEYKRRLNPSPIKILDAPDLQDDFYLNLMDWGRNNCLAVALKSAVYLWDANTSKVSQLCALPPNDPVTSVNWSVGHYLAVGTQKGRVLLYDVVAMEKVRSWTNHTSRVGCLTWASNVLSSGGRDHCIYHHDVRSPHAYFRALTGHAHEICGLEWNSDGNSLASGGNDNNVMIWDGHNNAILHRFTQHNAAIKAMSWSPHKRGLLVSGGGTADKTIKHWNTISGSLLSSHDTGSQVCNLIWSKKTDEIVSSHGYANPRVCESNQIHVWKTNKWEKTGTLSGHQSRVLYMSMSHDGNTIVTGAPDETLMFWDLFFGEGSIRREPEERSVCLR